MSTTYTNFLEEYKDNLLQELKLLGVDISKISQKKLDKYLNKKLRTENIVLFNNVKNVEYDTDTYGLINFILYSSTKPIITGYNTLFKPHNLVDNIPRGFLDNLKASRTKSKNEMFSYQNTDPDMYNMKELEQLIFKLLANSYYGA